MGAEGGDGESIIYTKPYTWFGAYGVGGLLGWWFFEYKQRGKYGIGSFATVMFDTVKDSLLKSWILMIVGTGILTFIVFITTPALFWGEV